MPLTGPVGHISYVETFMHLIDRIKAIHQAVPNTHLVMHGSSSVPQEWLATIREHGGELKETYGVPVEEIQEGIRNGVRKVHIDTDIRIAMTGAMGVLAEGNLGTEVPAQGRKDEIGGMAAAVQVFKDNMIRNKEMQAREAAELEARALRSQKIAALTEAFDREATNVVKTVSSAATEMQATASTMSATAEELIEWCRGRLAGYKRPRHIVFMEIPKTSTGKVQKFVLRERARTIDQA